MAQILLISCFTMFLYICNNAAGIPAMRFTDVERAERDYSAEPTGTLQVFFFKVKRIAWELRWPLHVYGLIAIRDHLDRTRNIIFARSRDNCQTITSQVRMHDHLPNDLWPYLVFSLVNKNSILPHISI
jgi:hypothetical protein